MTATALDSRYSWARLGVSLLIATVGNVGMWSVVAVLPAVAAEFGADRADASLPYTLNMIGFGLGNLLLGRAVDRFGAAPTIAAAGLLIGAGYAGAAMAPSVWVMATCHLAIGFGGASCFGPLIADVSHWFLRRRGLAVAITASGNYLSGAVWPLALSGVLVDGGWRAYYLALAAICVGGMLPLALFLRRRLPAEAVEAADVQARANLRSFPFSVNVLQALLAVAGIGCCVAMAMPQVHIVALSVDLGHGAAAGAEMLSIMLLGGCVSRLVSGALADRLGGVRTLLIGSVLQCLALFLYLPVSGLSGLYAVSLVFGLSQGGIVPSYAVIVREYMPARTAGAKTGAVIMATIVGMALGGWLSGWIHDATGGYRLALLNGIAFNMMNISIMLFLLSRSGPRRPVAMA